MISKEEQEDVNKIKELLKLASQKEKATLKLDALACKTFYKYIQQLENKQQKVIDYLEKEIEENRKCMNETNIKLDKLHYMKRIEYAKEILEIMRGEEWWKLKD